jgi:hypothetical protein
MPGGGVVDLQDRIPAQNVNSGENWAFSSRNLVAPTRPYSATKLVPTLRLLALQPVRISASVRVSTLRISRWLIHFERRCNSRLPFIRDHDFRDHREMTVVKGYKSQAKLLACSSDQGIRQSSAVTRTVFPAIEAACPRYPLGNGQYGECQEELLQVALFFISPNSRE